MTKILDSFARNFQRGGIPFLVFLGIIGYILWRIWEGIVPEDLSADEKAEKDVLDAITNQKDVKNLVSTHDKLIANNVYDACNSIYTKDSTLMELSKSFTSASVTKRIYSAYGQREISVLWFSPVKKNLVSSVMDHLSTSSETGKAWIKIFKLANLY